MARRSSITRQFIAWAARRTDYALRQTVVTFTDERLFKRFCFLWPDEHIASNGKHFNRPPWWRPFNVLLHSWRPESGTEEAMHDHPRWSATICLRGRIVERTPWGEKTLMPGSVVIRGHKAIHAFRVPEGYAGRTWTLFVVGRRNYQLRDHAEMRADPW